LSESRKAFGSVATRVMNSKSGHTRVTSQRSSRRPRSKIPTSSTSPAEA
jgi:hypothetical protein